MELENELALEKIKECGDYVEGNTILDIGCHAGDFVLSCGKYFGKNAAMIAFEPDENNYNTIISNIKELDNCKVVQQAIFYSDKSESVVLGTGDGNIGGYMVSLIENEHVNPNMFPSLHQYESKTFKLSKLEDFCDSAWLAKLDCEASEWNILEHSTAIKNTKHLIVEFHNHNVEYFLNFIVKHLPQHKIIMLQNRHCYLRKD
jgi:FkbM family methyltransferase